MEWMREMKVGLTSLTRCRGFIDKTVARLASGSVNLYCAFVYGCVQDTCSGIIGNPKEER